MAQNPTAKRVEQLIKQPIENAGYNLWDVRFLKEGSSWYLRVYIDKTTGINITDCTDVSRLIDPIIDEADPINCAYYLEVCSPGLQRELLRPEHFEFAKDKKVSVKLIRPRDNCREFSGILEKYDGAVYLSSNGTPLKFEKSELVSVRLDDME